MDKKKVEKRLKELLDEAEKNLEIGSDYKTNTYYPLEMQFIIEHGLNDEKKKEFWDLWEKLGV